jgi:hypothetical protein
VVAEGLLGDVELSRGSCEIQLLGGDQKIFQVQKVDHSCHPPAISAASFGRYGASLSREVLTTAKYHFRSVLQFFREVQFLKQRMRISVIAHIRAEMSVAVDDHRLLIPAAQLQHHPVILRSARAEAAGI